MLLWAVVKHASIVGKYVFHLAHNMYAHGHV